jgi:hypothetical protein
LESLIMEKKCVRCGAEFGCGAAAGEKACWCAELPPVLPVTDEGCLCPQCLRKEIEKRLAQAGQCAACDHAQRLRARGGSVIYLCGLSKTDNRFEKYPRLPVSGCRGYKSAAIAARP